MSDNRLEEKIAYLERSVEDLSAVVAHQDQELARLSRRVEMLMEREAQREADTAAGVVVGDQPPPHY